MLGFFTLYTLKFLRIRQFKKGAIIKRIRKSIFILLVVMLVMTISFSAVAKDNYPVLKGTVEEIQKYGNLTMDLKPSEFYEAGFELGDMMKVTIGNKVLKMPFVTSYNDVDTKNLLVRDDQDANLIVVAINMGDIAKTYDIEVGDKLTFALAKEEGYLSE